MSTRKRPRPYVESRASVTENIGITLAPEQLTAPEDADYVIGHANASLPNAQDLDSKTSGVMVNEPVGTMKVQQMTENAIVLGESDGTLKSAPLGGTNTVFTTVTSGVAPSWEPSTAPTSIPVTAAEGGTGRSTLTENAVLAGNGTGNVKQIVPFVGDVMVGLTGTPPEWFGIPATTAGHFFKLSGTPPVPGWEAVTIPSVPVTASEGGTGQTSLTSNGIILGNGTGAVNAVGPVATGSYLGSQGTGAPPNWVPGSLVSKLPVEVNEGGTGSTSIPAGSVVVGNGTSAVQNVAAVASGSFMASNGVGVPPVWAPGNLVSKLPVEVSEGGTGSTTLQVGSLVVGNGSSAVQTVSAVASGSFLGSNGVGVPPIWSPGNLVSKIPVDVAEGGTGLTSIPSGEIPVGAGTGPMTTTAQISPSQGGTGANIVAVLDGDLLIGDATSGTFLASNMVAASGTVLTSNGPFTKPTFQTVSATVTASVSTSVFTTSGSFTINANAKYVRITMIGGGGGGGNAVDSSSNRVCVGSGGAAGMFYQSIHPSSTFSGASRAVTIGAGGAATVNGGDTSIATSTSPMIVRGGKAGTTGTSGAICLVNGTYSTSGGSGPLNYTVFDNKCYGCGSSFAQGFAYGGRGGENSGWGRGGEARYCAPGDLGLDGVGGSGYGAGGGGAVSFNNATSRTGGSGTSGIVVIDQFIFS